MFRRVLHDSVFSGPFTRYGIISHGMRFSPVGGWIGLGSDGSIYPQDAGISSEEKDLYLASYRY